MIGTVGEPCLVTEEPEFAIKNIGLFKTKGELEQGLKFQQALWDIFKAPPVMVQALPDETIVCRCEEISLGQLRQAIGQGLVASAHDLSDGGLAVAAAESCIASGLGAHLEIPASASRIDRLLFAEGGARILVSVAPAQTVAWQEALDATGIPAQCLGVVASEAELQIQQAGAPLLNLPVAQLEAQFEQAIPRRMGVDLPPTA